LETRDIERESGREREREREYVILVHVDVTARDQTAFTEKARAQEIRVSHVRGISSMVSR
jgi:hypothetical protein